MHVGDILFKVVGSPFCKLATAAAVILSIIAWASPPTFDHLLMDYVHVESAKVDHQLQHMMVVFERQEHIKPVPK